MWDYLKLNKKSWKACVVDEELDNSLYVCKNKFFNTYYKRHIHQIIRGEKFFEEVGAEEEIDKNDNFLKDNIEEKEIDKYDDFLKERKVEY